MNFIHRSMLYLVFGGWLATIFNSFNFSHDIKELQSHTDKLAHECMNLRYEIDVISESISNKNPPHGS